ncbi:MAG: thioredoxin [Bacteroidetes bacterium]|nr:MAG: thioredoxin [Bacteroidota bacterium]
MNKIKLSLAAFILFSLAACASTKDTTTLSPNEFKDKVETLGSYTLLDVRSPEEFSMNHLKDAENINVNGQNFNEKIALLDKKTPVLVYCKSGPRSLKAASKLRNIGLTVFELDGGLLKWQSEGLPIEEDKKTSNSEYTLNSYNEAIAADKLVLVDFYATWCGPCKMMAPHIEVLKEKYKGQLTIIKVDTDKSTEVSKHFKISAIPLIKFYKDGKEVYDKTGYHSLEELQAVLDKNI